MYQLYKIWWYSIALILLIIFLITRDDLVFQFHSSYYVITKQYFASILSVYLLLIGLLYFLMRRQKQLIWIDRVHTYGTTFILIVLLSFILITELSQFGWHSTPYGWFYRYSWIKELSLLLFILAQSLLIIKLIRAIYPMR